MRTSIRLDKYGGALLKRETGARRDPHSVDVARASIPGAVRALDSGNKLVIRANFGFTRGTGGT